MELKQSQRIYYLSHFFSIIYSSAIIRLFPIAIFLGVIFWFAKADVYHQHFFDHGNIVLFYNFFRLIFIAFMAWIIYATGNQFLLSVTSKSYFQQYTNLERYVIGFGTGAGIWHIGMLLLGVCNLYYTSIMLIACSAVLLMSSRHLENAVRTVGNNINCAIKQPKISQLQLFPYFAILFVMAWLFLVRGLYPSGGHDYFTHYFHYYTNVIKQHGLAPNDVWYQYYYSKGAGLHFLGMLLTDPLSPPLMVFMCVATASFGLYSLTRRLTPQTSWPLFCIMIYLLYNLFPIFPLIDSSAGEFRGGEFQKIHEEVSALVVMAVWALSMTYIQEGAGKKAAYICLAATLVSAIILTQAIGIFFIAFFAIKILLAAINKNKADAKLLLLIAAGLIITMSSIFLLNYAVTGLISDQMINFSWRFADVEKLEHWGVLPNILMTAWIRYNYDSISVPWNFSGVFQQIISYTRSDFFSLALMSLFFPLIYAIQTYRKKQMSQLTAGDIFNFSLAIASVVLLIFMGINSSFAIINHPASLLGMRHNQFLYLIILTAVLCVGLHRYAEFINAKQKIQPDDTSLSDIRRRVLVNLILITIVFAVLGSIFGHSQVGSFLRFSSFFTPLIILICALSWGWLSGITTRSRFVSTILTKTVPIMLIAGVLTSWSHWPTNASNWSAAPVKFLRGSLSLADAYSNQLLGFPFGAIHPGTWEAVQHVPEGSRVWSTTVVSYCMAPGCQVESVISFKFSSRMNEILNGTPQVAKKILQQEGLNYFLFLSEYPLLDYLPFSQLFKPENMKEYFTVRWTDGKTYLLTWKSSSDKPVSDEFLKAYGNRLGEKEPPSFKFSESLGHLNVFMSMIKNQEHPLHTVNFPWKKNQQFVNSD